MNELPPMRAVLNNRGLRAIEAIRVLAAGLVDDEYRLVIKLLEVVTAELKQREVNLK